MNIIPQDQIDDEPIWFTTPISLLRNQAILATPAISVSKTHYSSRYFLTMNSPMLISKPTALETKMCGKMMVITSYFKDESQSLKNDHLIDLCIKFTLASDNFIQILNVPSKHWILVFWGKFGQISICNSFVTNGKYPQNLTVSKVHLASQTFTGLLFN